MPFKAHYARLSALNSTNRAFSARFWAILIGKGLPLLDSTTNRAFSWHLHRRTLITKMARKPASWKYLKTTVTVCTWRFLNYLAEIRTAERGPRRAVPVSLYTGTKGPTPLPGTSNSILKEFGAPYTPSTATQRGGYRPRVGGVNSKRPGPVDRCVRRSRARYNFLETGRPYQ